MTETEDLKLMAAEAEKAIKDRDADLDKVISKVGNVFFDVSKVGIKWKYEYSTGPYSKGEGTATLMCSIRCWWPGSRRRWRMPRKLRTNLGTTITSISFNDSPPAARCGGDFLEDIDMTDTNVTTESISNEIEKARQEEIELAQTTANWLIQGRPEG
ncbi:MAG: hypothetical protein ACYCXG_12360 [Acidiferrobacter sp.]